MRTYNSRINTYDNVSHKMCDYGVVVANSIQLGGNHMDFNLCYLMYQYLTMQIGASMINTTLQDKELDYLIKNV